MLNNTWYRPRDIVRWLNLAKQTFPNETYFSEQVVNGIRKDYSRFCWNEILEELNTVLSQNDLKTIEKVFSGFRAIFSRSSFEGRIHSLKYKNKEVRETLRKYDPGKLLDLLYSTGVIGNLYYEIGETQNQVRSIRFSFRGDILLLHDKDIMVHSALRPVFSIRENRY